MDYRTWPARAARTVTAVAAAIMISVGAASAAAAVTTDYHPTPVSRDFSTSVGGWTAGHDAFERCCASRALTCPAVTNQHVADRRPGRSR